MGFRILLISYLYLAIVFTSFGNAGSGQDSTGNLVSYAGNILIKANISTQTDRFILKEKNGTGLKLQANNEYKAFLSLDYEFIGFSYGFSPKLFQANDDNVLKGESSYSNYRFLIFLGKWLQTVEFSKTRGYYTENTADFIPGWRRGIDPYFQFPNLKNVVWSLSTAYIFNKNFSFKNIVYQTEWQRRSAGSFVPTLFCDLTNMSFDQGGLAAKQRDYNIRFGLGYYHTFIIGQHFFIAPNIVPSIGVRISRSVSKEGIDKEVSRNTYFSRFLEGGLKMGFSSGKFVAGGGINLSFNQINEDKESVVKNDRVFGILYFGYRINTPKIIDKAYQKFNELTGLD